MEDSGAVCAETKDGDPTTNVDNTRQVPDINEKTETKDASAAAGGDVVPFEEAQTTDLEAQKMELEVQTTDLEVQTADLEAVSAEICAGSDSGVEGCGRALSSGGGSRSCASSVVSCGSVCGSETSSVGGAGTRARRVTVASPPARRAAPSATAPRPVTAPRAPNLATRERARSREKPAVPEKPRPLTPKPRIRPTADLPNLVRESPALRAKPTKTSSARCRTPSSPNEEKRWPTLGRLTGSADAARGAADKYGTLPRRRRDDTEPASPHREAGTPPIGRRPNLSRSMSSRVTKTRVRIFAERTSQTVLTGEDVEAALGGLVPNIEMGGPVTMCHRGVQASARDEWGARLAAAEAALEAERELRARRERELEAERAAARRAATSLADNTRRLLDLAGTAHGSEGTEGCLRALDEQLRSTGDLVIKQRAEIDMLKERCDSLHTECVSRGEVARSLEARLVEAEREAAEMQDFLAAETSALSLSLRDAEADLARTKDLLDKRRGECRQLVRLCEQRRQEALSAAARARGGQAAARALDALADRLARLAAPVSTAPAAATHSLYSRGSSVELSPLEEGAAGVGVGVGVGGGALVAAVTRALRLPLSPAPAPVPTPRSPASEDTSAELLDSETEPCLLADPEMVSEWTGWSGSELSPVGDEGEADSSVSERDELSLANLSLAIAARHRSERHQANLDTTLLEKVLNVDSKLTELLRSIRLASEQTEREDSDAKPVNNVRESIESECRGTEALDRKLADADCGRGADQYWHFNERLKNELVLPDEENLEVLEKELSCCSVGERRALYAALDSALSALGMVRAQPPPPPLARLRHALERAAFALLAAPPAPASTTPATPAPPTPSHTVPVA